MRTWCNRHWKSEISSNQIFYWTLVHLLMRSGVLFICLLTVLIFYIFIMHMWLFIILYTVQSVYLQYPSYIHFSPCAIFLYYCHKCVNKNMKKMNCLSISQQLRVSPFTLNPSNAEGSFNQSTRTQRFLKTI